MRTVWNGLRGWLAGAMVGAIIGGPVLALVLSTAGAIFFAYKTSAALVKHNSDPASVSDFEASLLGGRRQDRVADAKRREQTGGQA